MIAVGVLQVKLCALFKTFHFKCGISSVLGFYKVHKLPKCQTLNDKK